MSELYSRILLWHKLVAMQTGGLALCSAKHRLNRDEARGWIEALRNVADDMTQFLRDGTFILDDKGRRVVDCAGERASLATATEAQHEKLAEKANVGPKQAVSRKAGGLRIATRKTK